MARINHTRVALRTGASYRAGQYLYEHGPLHPRALFAVVDFGNKTGHQEDALQRAISSGWLSEQADGKISISPFARAHYSTLAGEQAKPAGKIAGPRMATDVFTRPPLSKKNIPTSRGTRQDIPAWSVREKASFKSLCGGGS